MPRRCRPLTAMLLASGAVGIAAASSDVRPPAVCAPSVCPAWRCAPFFAAAETSPTVSTCSGGFAPTTVEGMPKTTCPELLPPEGGFLRVLGVDRCCCERVCRGGCCWGWKMEGKGRENTSC